MDYPDSLPLKILELQHPSYAELAPTLAKIDDLVAGGNQLERKKAAYLKPRPGEDPELYKIRLERFTYTNVLGGAIAQQASKLASGVLAISGLPEKDKFWAKFRENNGAKRDEKTLLSDVFRQSLKFKRVFLHVDKPYSEFKPQTKQQEELLELDPYVCLYTPLDVTNWGEDARENELEWIKVRQIYVSAEDPLKPALTKVSWMFVDETHTARYEAFVKLGKNGQITDILDADGKEVDGGEDALIPQTRFVPHGVGELPVIRMDLPCDLWVTDQVYLKAQEHLNLENSRYDTAMMVGYVQRTWEPFQKPDSDLDATFVDSEEELQTGNQYVIKGRFSFNEASGSSINTVSGLLQEIRDYVQDAIGMARASATKGAVEQSGISKKMDMVISELVLRAYGQILCATYQDLLQLVGKVAGRSTAETQSYSVTGMDSFELDSLDSAIAIALELQNTIELIPPTALKLFYGQLANLLVKNTSAEQQDQINRELEDIFGGAGSPLARMNEGAAAAVDGAKAKAAEAQARAALAVGQA